MAMPNKEALNNTLDDEVDELLRNRSVCVNSEASAHIIAAACPKPCTVRKREVQGWMDTRWVVEVVELNKQTTLLE